MKKIIVVCMAFVLLLGNMVSGIAGDNDKKKQESADPIVVKIINPDFVSGRIYLTDTFFTPYYFGRINPGYITTVKIPAPFPQRTYRLVIVSGGRITHTAILENELEPGDKIEWDLAYNLFSWEPKEG